MKKIALIGLMLAGIGLCAWPCHPCPPPAPHPWHHHGYGCWGGSGLYNAAAITSIVANGLSIVNNLATPRTVVAPAPVVQQVYAQPVVTTVAPTVVQTATPVVYGTPVVPCVQTPVVSYVRLNGVTVPVCAY